MKSYFESEVFAASEIRMLQLATQIVADVPSAIRGKGVRCHELARYVGERLGLEVQDGIFGFVEHSWLWTKPLEERLPWRLPNILDVYVPGQVPQVQLVHLATSLPMPYRRGEPRTDIRQDVLAFLRER